MSARELGRVEVLSRIKRKEMGLVEAAELLGASYRQNGFAADRLSSHRFGANQFRLLLHTAAYNLVNLFRLRLPRPLRARLLRRGLATPVRLPPPLPTLRFGLSPLAACCDNFFARTRRLRRSRA